MAVFASPNRAGVNTVYMGLSSDTKPTGTGVAVQDVFLESDTGRLFTFTNAGTWVAGAITVAAASVAQAPAQSAPGSQQSAQLVVNTGAASTVTCTIFGAAGKFTYVTGFEVTGLGATAGTTVTVTLAGLVGSGTMQFVVSVPAGVTTPITPLIVEFPVPIPSSAVNTNITLQVPSFGAGNTNVAANLHGFLQ